VDGCTLGRLLNSHHPSFLSLIAPRRLQRPNNPPSAPVQSTDEERLRRSQHGQDVEELFPILRDNAGRDLRFGIVRDPGAILKLRPAVRNATRLITSRRIPMVPPSIAPQGLPCWHYNVRNHKTDFSLVIQFSDPTALVIFYFLIAGMRRAGNWRLDFNRRHSAARSAKTKSVI
jgi:hypothetical protein